jgi:hypothetical protein
MSPEILSLQMLIENQESPELGLECKQNTTVGCSGADSCLWTMSCDHLMSTPSGLQGTMCTS